MVLHPETKKIEEEAKRIVSNFEQEKKIFSTDRQKRKIKQTLVKDKISDRMVFLKTISTITGRHNKYQISPFSSENVISLCSQLSKVFGDANISNNSEEIFLEFPQETMERTSKEFKKILSNMKNQALIEIRKIRHETFSNLKGGEEKQKTKKKEIDSQLKKYIKKIKK